jgi:hypothetical protein
MFFTSSNVISAFSTPLSTWNTRTVTYMCPPGATAVMIHYYNDHTGSITVGIRKVGASDATFSIPAGAAGLWIIELDANRAFESYFSDSAGGYGSVVAYFTSATLTLVTPTNYTPGSANTWTTQSIAAATGANTAAFAVIRYGGTRHAARHPSHTAWDVVRTTGTVAGAYDIVPLNASEEFQYQTESTSTAVTLIGYIDSAVASVLGSTTKTTFSYVDSNPKYVTSSLGATASVVLYRMNASSKSFRPSTTLGGYGAVPNFFTQNLLHGALAIVGDRDGTFHYTLNSGVSSDVAEVGAIYHPSNRKQVQLFGVNTATPFGTTSSVELPVYAPKLVGSQPMRYVVVAFLRLTNMSSLSVTGVTDSFGNAYSLVSSTTPTLDGGTGGLKIYIYSAKANQAVGTGNPSVTVTVSSAVTSASFLGANVFAISNYDDFSPLIGITAASADTSNSADPSVTVSADVPAGSALCLMAAMWQSGFSNQWAVFTGDSSVLAGDTSKAYVTYHQQVATDATNPTISVATGQTTNGWAAIGLAVRGAYTGPYTYSGPSKATSIGQWRPSVSGADLADMINEDPANTGDYIVTDFKNSVAVFDLPKITDPASSSYHVVEVYASGTGDNPQVKVSLWQGTSTQIATWTQAVTSTPTLYRFTLTGAEADAITNYDDLDVKVESL